jgi:ribosomal protein L11 methyltransferase
LSCYPAIDHVELIDVTEKIDWHAQWGVSAETSALHFDLAPYAGQADAGFVMQPGAGFGDLTHPTTRLVLRLMASRVQGCYVIDLGTGSGVLSLAALKLGAIGACGIDIDCAALQHATANAKLNALESHCHFQLPGAVLSLPADTPLLLLMNMITSEQLEAWRSIPALHTLPLLCITSGVLQSQASQYLADCHVRGWQLIEISHEGLWSGFAFQT